MSGVVLALLLATPAQALLSPPSLLTRNSYHGRVLCRAGVRRHELVRCQDSQGAKRWRPVLLGASGGAALVAARRFGGAGAVTAALRIACVALPLASAARHFRDGQRRQAFMVLLLAAYRRFCSRWWQYLTIPLFAGGVGWLTNKVAVDMIFWPVEFAGLRLRTWPNQPLGLFGWQVRAGHPSSDHCVVHSVPTAASATSATSTSSLRAGHRAVQGGRDGGAADGHCDGEAGRRA